MRDQKRVTLYIAGSTRGDGTCSFSPLLQEPLYFLLLRPTANPLAPNSSTHPLSRVSLSVSRGAVPLLVLFPPSNTDIPAAMYPFSTVYYANIILEEEPSNEFRRTTTANGRGWCNIEGGWFREVWKYGVHSDAAEKLWIHNYFSFSVLSLHLLWKKDYKG